MKMPSPSGWIFLRCGAAESICRGIKRKTYALLTVGGRFTGIIRVSGAACFRSMVILFYDYEKAGTLIKEISVLLFYDYRVMTRTALKNTASSLLKKAAVYAAGRPTSVYSFSDSRKMSTTSYFRYPGLPSPVLDSQIS